jgi:VIT1/CCC1 family predicted Fe2+/Mn2+ transporter
VLAPSERASEILFGLIMVLTFTGSLSAATAGREETRTMLIGALGCNLAWGIVDAVFYLMNTLSQRGRDLLIVWRVRDAATVEDAHRLIAESLPETVAEVLRPAELDAIRLKWLRLPAPPRRPRLGKDDFVGALGVFLLVFVSTFPVVIPFLVVHDVMLALRLSNAVAIVMLFWAGWSLGRYAGYSPWRVGLWVVAIGLVLVGAAIALGG